MSREHAVRQSSWAQGGRPNRLLRLVAAALLLTLNLLMSRASLAVSMAAGTEADDLRYTVPERARLAPVHVAWVVQASATRTALVGVACPGRMTCYALASPPTITGTVMTATLLSSHDGGRHWQLAGPVGPSVAPLLACPSASICLTLDSQTHAALYPTDGGQIWSAAPPPPGDNLADLDCPTSAHRAAEGLLHADSVWSA